MCIRDSFWVSRGRAPPLSDWASTRPQTLWADQPLHVCPRTCRPNIPMPEHDEVPFLAPPGDVV
eukprot:2997428-Prorocentrum_lima.AAC.1